MINVKFHFLRVFFYIILIVRDYPMDTHRYSEESQEISGTGNTKTVPNRSRGWCFTLNNFNEVEYNILKLKISLYSQWIIAKEVGELGTPHLQGYFYSKNQVAFSSLKNINNRIHWERAKGKPLDNLNYCMKEGLFETNMEIPYVEKPNIISELKVWQQKIVDIIRNDEPDDRKIYWYYDEEGGKGKSALCKYLAHHNLASVYRSGKASDIKAMILLDKKCRDFCIDLSRSNENFVSYTVMEEIKDGFIISTKYEGGKLLMTTPHLFIFANFMPKEFVMSSDRFEIVDLSIAME